MNSANGLLEWILFKYLNKAHIRRYLVDAVPKRKNLDYSQPAVQGILYIDRLFRLEETIKVKSTTFDSLKKARLEKEVPVIEGFLSWLDMQKPTRGFRMDRCSLFRWRPG